MIIGLTGKNGAGKGEVAKFLRERGFAYFSLSDVLREEAAKQGKEVSRENLVELGNDLRVRLGPGALAERVFSRLDPEKHYVVDSVRHPSEVQVLKRRSDFFLANVRAPQKLRFERMRARNREKDPSSFEDFLRLEQTEAQNTDTSCQQLDRAIAMADFVLENAGPLKMLHDRIKEVLLDLSRKHRRPGWDEYFMGIAKVTALRSNCMKRRVAAVIVKDKRLIASGYNGTPRGVMNCIDGGCPRCRAIETSGKSLEECLCSHAEENAIVQSAYHGVSIKEATLYSTFSPCLMCTKMIINAGIKEVIFNVQYPLGETALNLLKEAGIHIKQLPVAFPDPAEEENK